ncbi:MAG: hypothetical protein ABSA17_00930 [Rhabdochlamydiaceae bacterium]|jgi:hypothetical protein
MTLLLKAIWITAALPAILLGAVVEGERAGEVRVVPVERTPEPETVEIKIAFPRQGELETDNPMTIQLRLEAYGLGVITPLPRNKEIRDSKQGQAVHFIIDGRPYLSVNEAIDEMSETEEIDYDQTINIKLPYKLQDGEHVLRVFPVRSYDECLKGPDVFEACTFFVGQRKPTLSVDLSMPYITYNQPQGEFDGKQPILLDFFVKNTQLSKDGYKVRLTIDRNDKRLLTEWNPHYIYGLKRGSHTIKLELLDQHNKVVKPLFNDLERTIVVR